MIDDYKIKKAARQISEKVVDAKGFDDSKPTHLAFLDGHVDGFNAGAKWMQEEFLKDLWHPASEEPKNLEFIVFTNDIFGEIYFFTMQRDNSLQSWETEVACHGIKQWAYRNDIVSLILKGGK
nr:MAG TPA: hypothetical protein [Bacteriophage sp.]